MLGLSLAATRDVLTLSSCCYLSCSTRPDSPSGVHRGAATLWLLTWGAGVKWLRQKAPVYSHQCYSSELRLLTSEEEALETWHVPLPFQNKHSKESLGWKASPSSFSSQEVLAIFSLSSWSIEATLFGRRNQSGWSSSHIYCWHSSPQPVFSCLLGNVPTAISHLRTLTMYGLNGANQPRREPLTLYFPIRACSSMGKEEESSATFWSQLQPGVSCQEDNEFGEPAGRLEADCKPGRTSCYRTKGSLAAWCLSWCCDNAVENTDLAACTISKHGN